MKPIRCSNCGIVVQVPPGGRRLCGCGAWLSAEEDDSDIASVIPMEETDTAAIERLTATCRKLLAETAKVIVGQQDVLEELLIAISPAAIACSSACRAWPRR